jgi:hypothetical protein
LLFRSSTFLLSLSAIGNRDERGRRDVRCGGRDLFFRHRLDAFASRLAFDTKLSTSGTSATKQAFVFLCATTTGSS